MPARVEAFFRKLYGKLQALPITIFYKYLWEKNRRLLAKTLVVSYVLPVVLELLPWYASRRKIGNYLRARRVKINHNMVTGKDFSARLILGYLLLTVLHAIIDTINRHIMNRLALQNRLLIKRFVMERLLYSEIGGFNALKSRDNMGPAELEFKINSSIGLTLNFFNDTLPSIFASAYAFAREGSDLLVQRGKVDPLLIIHPIVVGLVHKIGGLIKTKLIDKKSGDMMGYHSTMMSRMVCNALEGLADIQVNNLQQAQILLLDQMIAEELSYSQGVTSFISRTWTSISSRSVLDFIVEVYVAHSVMSRRSLSNKDYRTMQLDIDRVIRLARRTYHSIRLARHMWKDQSKVIKLLNIPNFIEEDKTLKRVSGTFKELRISNVVFGYKNHLGMPEPDMPPALDLQGEMVIEPGRRYALIGQNRAGKSTLNHILCKLYLPDEGEITLDGVPYSEISRTSLRSFITYVSQRPFIFPGTIRDNILVGNPDASEEEVEAAAEAAGVFAFAEAAGISSRYLRSPSMNNLKYSTSSPNLHSLEEQQKQQQIIQRIQQQQQQIQQQLSKGGESESEGEGEGEGDSDGLGEEESEEEESDLESEYNDDLREEGENGKVWVKITGIAQSGCITEEDIKKNLENSNTEVSKPQESENKESGEIILDATRNSVRPLRRKHRKNNRTSKKTNQKASFSILDSPNMNDNSNNNSNNNETDGTKKKGWFASLFSSELPRAFPRTYPEDTSDDEEGPVRPPPIIPHKSGPHSSHPILDQEIEARGQNISGGFAQSIALARIFVRPETKILILDEAMSQMDAYKKREIIFPKLFEFTRKNSIALIIITHDLLSIQDVDHVFVLDQGRLEHQGTHKELLEQKAPGYMRLLGC